MINAEKYKDQLLKFVEENHDSLFGLNKNSEPISCAVSRCNNCQFGFKKNNYIEGYSCSAAKMKWLLSEYKEPVKLTRMEYEFLKYILNYTEYKYIARDRIGAIFIYENKPEKHVDTWRVLVNGGGYTNLTILDELFKFIKWLDLKPTSIKDVLDNCEVVENDL